MKNGLCRSEQRTGSRTQKQPLDRKSAIQVSCEPNFLDKVPNTSCRHKLAPGGSAAAVFAVRDGRGFGNSGDGDRAAEQDKGDGLCDSELFDPTLRVQKLPFRRPRWLSTSRLSQACLTPARDTRSRSIRSSRMRASRERWSSSMLGTLWPRRLVLGMAPSKVRILRAQPGAASANISPGSEDV